mgnify:CR=1 FL=1
MKHLIKNTHIKNQTRCIKSENIYHNSEITPDDDNYDYSYQHPVSTRFLSFNDALTWWRKDVF